MSVSKQRLYDLLPAYIRFRDQQLRDPELEIAPLEALIKALELPLHAIEENIDALYRGWFIETCDDWKIPYLADLLAVRGLDAADADIPSLRRRVANAIAYRRRKGTPAALARAVEDATGWSCRLSKTRNRTAATQSLDTPVPERLGTADLRAEPAPGDAGEVSELHPHTVDLRQDPEALGTGSALDGLDIELYRLKSNPVTDAGAAPAAEHSDRGYRFHPGGVDTVLFNAPQTPDGTVYRTDDRHLPVPLRRRVLAQEIAARRRGEDPEDGFLGDDPVFRIKVRDGPDGPWQEIAPEDMMISDLSDWHDPVPAPDWGTAKVAVDPETGRILFRDADPDREVQVDYSYGLSDDLGGGTYPRDDRPQDFDTASWRAIVDRDLPPGVVDGVPRFDSLEKALDAWHAAPPETRDNAAIRIDDSARHAVGEVALDLPAEHRLSIRAGERSWPQIEGEISVPGEAGSHLELDGVGVQGRLVLDGDPSLTLRHATVHPPDGESVAIDHRGGEQARSGEVAVENSIVVGPIQLPASLEGLTISDSIVDAGTGQAIRGVDVLGMDGEWGETAQASEVPPGPPTRIDRSTVFGRSSLLKLRHAGNTLFTGPVETLRTHEGEAHHCYFPAGSTTPPRRQCLEGPRTAEGGWLRPSFTSTTYGRPGYAQLTPCSGEILRGGEQGREIGVYHRLAQADRMANLKEALEEFLPAGTTEKISFAT